MCIQVVAYVSSCQFFCQFSFWHLKFSSCKTMFWHWPCDSANRCILHQDAHVLGPYHSLPAGVVLIDSSVTFSVHESRINMTAEPSMEPSNLMNLYLQQNFVAKTNNIGAKNQEQFLLRLSWHRLDSHWFIPYQLPSHSQWFFAAIGLVILDVIVGTAAKHAKALQKSPNWRNSWLTIC